MCPAVFSVCAFGVEWIVGAGSPRVDGQTPSQIQISNDADDGFYDSVYSIGWHSSPEVAAADWVGSSSSLAQAWVIGYRFPSTGIQSTDTIQSAYLKVTSAQVMTSGPFDGDSFATSSSCINIPCQNSNSTFRVYGVAQDDGGPFSGASGNTPLDVPYTNAYTDYTTTGPGDDHGQCQGVNNGQNTCTHIIDVTNIVREVISQPGWTPSSAMRFVLTATGTTSSNVYAGFEDSSVDSTKAATLIINPPLPTIVSSGAWGTAAAPAGSYPTTYATGPFVYPGASTLLLFLGDYYNYFGGGLSSPPTVTDSCGNNWSILAGPADYAAQVYDMRSTVYYVQSPVQCPAGDTITVTVELSEPIFLHFLAVAGSDTSQAPVVSSITNSGSPGVYTTTATTGPVTLANSGLLVSWAFGDNDSPHTFTPQSGFITDTNSTPNYLTAVYENVASGTYTNTFSISPSDGWQTVLIGVPASNGSGSGGSSPPSITSATTASDTMGTAFSYQITATNSPTSYAASGLPAGLAVSTTSGLISGTPTATGTFNVTLSAINGSGTGTGTLTLTVTNQVAPVITWATPAAIPYGTALSATQLNASSTVPGTFVYTPAAGTVLSAGTQTLSVTLTPTDTTDYTTATQTVQLVVNQAAAPTITWVTPAAISYGTALSATQLNASSTVSGTFVYSPAAGTVLSAGTQTLTVTFTPTDTTDYPTATQTVQLVVNKAGPPTITWTAPAVITYGAALSATQLDASATVPGTFVYSPAAGTVLNAGTQTLSLTFTPTDTTDYATATQTVQLVVNKAPQNIGFTLPATANYGVAPIALTATGGSSGNAVTFSVVSGPASISGNNLTIAGTGIVTVAANQAGSSNYLAATQVTQSVTVVGTTLALIANNATRVFGTSNPIFTGTVTGALNGDTFTETFSTAATMSSSAGTYAIVPSVAGANLAAYSVTVQNGTLTVTQAGTTLSLEASSGTVNAGQALTLTANVISATSGTPTGTVIFYDGTVQLGAGTLSAGTAVYSTSSLAAGTTHVLTAVYGGDTNFTGSSTSSSTSVVVGAAPDFTLTVSGSSSETVTEGSTASYQLIASPLAGTYPGAISFVASGLPNGATVSFSPASIAANGGQQTVTASIQTAPGVGVNSNPSLGRRLAPISAAVLLLPFLGIGRIRRRGRYLSCMLILLVGATAAATALTGCTAGYTSTMKAQSYAVTITAAGGGLQHSVSVTLEVQ